MSASTSRNPESLVPSRYWISTIVLFLRCFVGLQFLRLGVASYLVRVNSAGGSAAQAIFLPVSAGPLLLDVFQYTSIVLGVALVLGFFTRIASAGLATLLALSLLIQVVLEIKVGQLAGLNQNVLSTRQFLSFQLLAMLWLSGVATNLFSLDGLMFQRKRFAPKTRSTTPQAGPLLTGGSFSVQPEPELPKEVPAWAPRDLDFNDPEFGIVSKSSQDAV